jgi:DNA-binding CsgD family transcriptional regulator
MPLRLAAWRGQASIVLSLLDAMTRGARQRGEGCALAAADYSTAILYNGLGQHDTALDVAQRAAATDDMAISSWALCEVVEAASRSGRDDEARDAVERLSERTGASGTPWAKGTEAHARALVAGGERAESLHHQAIEWLGRCRMKAHLARARLGFGEWLRRESRRVEAREQLRGAYESFVSMGADGFAERARHELAAVGERPRRQRCDAPDELTLQEERIAQLARNGRTNPEIAAELFISARTVEWHLRKVFTKLGISSRKELYSALPGEHREAERVL